MNFFETHPYDGQGDVDSDSFKANYDALCGRGNAPSPEKLNSEEALRAVEWIEHHTIPELQAKIEEKKQLLKKALGLSESAVLPKHIQPKRGTQAYQMWCELQDLESKLGRCEKVLHDTRELGNMRARVVKH